MTAALPCSGRHRFARRRLLRALLAGVLALGVVTVAVPAEAHNVLVSTSPTDRQSVDVTPEAVVLTFDQPAVAMGTQILVTGPAGPVQLGAPRLVDTTVTQALQGGAPAGAYTVAWRVTSNDGHPVTGTFTFTSKAAGTGQRPSEPSSTAAPAATPSPTAADPAGASRGYAAAALAAVLLLAGTVFQVLRRRRRRRRP